MAITLSKNDECLVFCNGSGSQLAVVLGFHADGRVRLTKFRRQSGRWTKPALYVRHEIVSKLKCRDFKPWMQRALATRPA